MRSADEWIDMAKQFKDQGGLFLLLTGGEPAMHPDFSEIYEEISKLGLYVTLFTNGTTIDDKIIDLLRKRPPAMVGVTIYGSSEDTYNKFGGSPGSFQRAVDGLDRLLTIPNLMLDVRFVVCSENYKDLQSVYDLVAQRNKLITLDFGSCAPVRGACSDTRKLRLTKDQVEELQKTVQRILTPETSETNKLLLEISDCTDNDDRIGKSITSTTTNRGWQCNGGKISVYIAWDGRMYPCDMSSYPYTFPFEQGFKSAAFDIRNQVDSLLYPERCLTCANIETTCNCIPKAQNEMRDCARTGERCSYKPKA
jgi:MoaA/NifB/PqqE/SkfB family radical SAM enzyme